jgi:hypothetical protein
MSKCQNVKFACESGKSGFLGFLGFWGFLGVFRGFGILVDFEGF